MTLFARPMISIGVPTYNRPLDLARCLEGLMTQTYTNLEIIVSDNASPGKAVDEVMEKIVLRDARVKYFKQTENRGALHNFQFLLDSASGDFFMWAGDDDHRDSNYVEALLNQLIENPECSISFCDFIEVYEDGTAVRDHPSHLKLLKPFTRATGRLLSYFMQPENLGKANLIYGLMRKSALRDFKWDEFSAKHGQYGIDMLFVFRILGAGPLALSHERLYRCTVGNIKHYSPGLPRSFSEKLAGQLVVIAQQLRYAIQYLSLSQRGTFTLIALAMPLKMLDIFVRLFLVAETRNMVARIRRWSTR